MYLSELELHGFKSFANKTHVKFDSGLTAIVGPNGCGKSNIVDSIRWVLGEQRPSHLRSASMSNVIFNGTATKKALGLSEVSVTIENNKGILPTEFKEVKITRRLYRSGESEYLLNNTPCRLKDIIELFMDTGMGSNSYSVIELKMVEEILSDKNNERTALFEEAAGITKYKERRKQTFRKLAETQGDLQRIEDILVEIRKNARSLQLQASRAQRAREYNVELQRLELGLARFEYDAINAELEPLMERIVNAESEKEEFNRNLEQLEQLEEEARRELRQKEQKLSEVQQKQLNLQNAVRETETSLRITREKIKNEEQSIRQYEQDIYQSEDDIKELRKTIKKSEKQLEEKKSRLNIIREELEKARGGYEAQQSRLSEARSDLDSITRNYDEVTQKLNRLQTQKVRIESRLENSSEDEGRLQEQITQITRDIDSLKDQEARQKQELSDAERQLETMTRQLDEQRKQKEELSARQNELKDNIRSERSRLDAVQSEIKLLENIAKSHEAFPGSVKYLIEENKDGRFQVLSDVFSTDEKHAVALESVLGEACYYIVTVTIDEARQAASQLKDNDKGKATFIPLDQLTGSYDIKKGSLCDQVSCDNRYSALKALLLGHVFVYDSIAAAEEGVRQNSGTVGVTINGDVVTAQRFLRSGSQSQNVGLRVGLKDRIEKLEHKALSTEQRVENLEQELQATQRQHAQIDTEQTARQVRESEQLLRKLGSQQSSLSARKSVYEKNLSEVGERLKRLGANVREEQASLKELDPQIEEISKKAKKLLGSQISRRNDLEKIEENQDKARSLYNDIKLKHQAAENEVLNLEKDKERASQSITSIKERLQQRSENAKQSKDRIIGHRSTIEELEVQLEEQLEEKGFIDALLREADKDCARQRGRIHQVEEDLKNRRRKREMTIELLHQLDMAKSQLDMKAKGIADHIWENYNILMENLEDTLPEDIEPDAARERITSLKQKLKNIGEVNPLAIEEYEKEKERLDFYEQQINDLMDAEHQLRETISEINETAQKRFSTTFEQIRANFKSIFGTLFNEDDQCDLLIEEDEDDPLDARIEIIANPRGKRPSTISQLSTGEKTVTAIALLFAIYLVKPSPFCILDEVDAPLDDANIERFVKMLRRFIKDTQFIIITHNKKMMEKAEMLYGVTMPEPGISRLVGVRMDNVPA